MLRRNIGNIEYSNGDTKDMYPSITPFDIEPIKGGDTGLVIDPYADVKEIVYRNYLYSGQVVDAYNKPIPFASVLLMLDGIQYTGSSTDSNGYFSIKTPTKAESIVISSAGYKAWEWPASEEQKVFELEPDVKDIDPVVLPPGTKKNYTWLLLAGGLLLLTNKKKKVSGTNTFIKDNWFLIAGGTATVLLWPSIKRIFTGINSASALVEDVVSAPGRIIKYLNDSTFGALKTAVYDLIYKYVSTHNFGTVSTSEGFNLYNELLLMDERIISSSQKATLLQIWMKDKTEDKAKALAEVRKAYDYVTSFF